MTRRRLLVGRFDWIRAIILTRFLLVEVLVAGIERVDDVNGTCWMDGRPAISGERLPGRRHKIRLLCKSCDESTFGDNTRHVTTITSTVGLSQG